MAAYYYDRETVTVGVEAGAASIPAQAKTYTHYDLARGTVTIGGATTELDDPSGPITLEKATDTDQVTVDYYYDL